VSTFARRARDQISITQGPEDKFIIAHHMTCCMCFDCHRARREGWGEIPHSLLLQFDEADDASFLMMMLSVLTFLSLSDKLTEQGQVARLLRKDCACRELLSYDEKGRSSWEN